MPSPLSPRRRTPFSRRAPNSGTRLGKQVDRHSAPAPAPPLDHHLDQEGLLDAPDLLDQLRDREVVRLLDAELHQPPGKGVCQLGLVLQAELPAPLAHVLAPPPPP